MKVVVRLEELPAAYVGKGKEPVVPENLRLPKGIVDAEVEYLKKIGVKIIADAAIGRLKTIDDLFAEGFHAVFLGVARM